MLLKLNNYDDVYATFKWHITECYNISSDKIDKELYSNKTAIFNVLDKGKIKK